jgi:hypothetical protein
MIPLFLLASLAMVNIQRFVSEEQTLSEEE